jgi:hypothetical protein
VGVVDLAGQSVIGMGVEGGFVGWSLPPLPFPLPFPFMPILPLPLFRPFPFPGIPFPFGLCELPEHPSPRPEELDDPLPFPFSLPHVVLWDAFPLTLPVVVPDMPPFLVNAFLLRVCVSSLSRSLCGLFL